MKIKQLVEDAKTQNPRFCYQGFWTMQDYDLWDFFPYVYGICLLEIWITVVPDFFSELIRRGVIYCAGKILPQIILSELIMRGDSVSHYVDRLFWE